MKKFLTISLVALSMLFIGCGDNMPQTKKSPMNNYRAVPADKAEILQSGEAKMYCPVCGMTLPMFYRTNHAADIGGETHQYCSGHCAHEEAYKTGKELTNVRVVDNTTLKFIKAEDAFYVVGSKKPATMAMVSKYAFGTESAAKEFVEQFGGEVKRYSDVEAMIKKNLEKEMIMIEKRQAKAAMMGEKIYNKMCKQTAERFKTPAEAKVFLKKSKICGEIQGKEAQQVSLYLSKR